MSVELLANQREQIPALLSFKAFSIALLFPEIKMNLVSHTDFLGLIKKATLLFAFKTGLFWGFKNKEIFPFYLKFWDK